MFLDVRPGRALRWRGHRLGGGGGMGNASRVIDNDINTIEVGNLRPAHTRLDGGKPDLHPVELDLRPIGIPARVIDASIIRETGCQISRGLLRSLDNTANQKINLESFVARSTALLRANGNRDTVNRIAVGKRRRRQAEISGIVFRGRAVGIAIGGRDRFINIRDGTVRVGERAVDCINI